MESNELRQIYLERWDLTGLYAPTWGVYALKNPGFNGFLTSKSLSNRWTVNHERGLIVLDTV